MSSRLKSQSILPKTKIMISQKAPIVSFTAIPYFKEGSLGYLLAYLTPRATFPGSCKASPEPCGGGGLPLNAERTPRCQNECGAIELGYTVAGMNSAVLPVGQKLL